MKIFLTKIINWLETWWLTLFIIGLCAVALWLAYVAKTGNFPDWIVRLIAG